MASHPIRFPGGVNTACELACAGQEVRLYLHVSAIQALSRGPALVVCRLRVATLHLEEIRFSPLHERRGLGLQIPHTEIHSRNFQSYFKQYKFLVWSSK